MNEEYKMLRAEALESINKQDTLTNIVFAILGASGLYSSRIADVTFIILVELISAVLLARLLHYRHVSLYIATYLARMEEVCNIEIHWETNLRSFHNSIPKCNHKYKIMQFIVNFSRQFKHLGNLILAIYIFSPIFHELENMFIVTNGYIIVNVEILLAVIALTLNFIFSIGICFCYKLRPNYDSVWEDILPNQEIQHTK